MEPENGGGLLIASGNQQEKQISALNVHGEISNLINNQHPVLSQYFELVRQAVLKMCFFELLNKLVAVDVVSGKAVLRCHKAQGGGKVGLAHAWRAEEDQGHSQELCKPP